MRKMIKWIMFTLIILCTVNILILVPAQVVGSSNDIVKKYGVYETSPEYGVFFEFNITAKREWTVGERTFVNISIRPIFMIKYKSIEISQLELIILQLEKDEVFYYSIIPNEGVNSLSLSTDNNTIRHINKELTVLPEFQGALTFKIQIYFRLDNNNSLKGESFSNFIGYVEVRQFPEYVLEYNSTALAIFLLIIVLLFANIAKNQYKENRGFMSLIIVLLIAMIISAGIFYISTQENCFNLVQEKNEINKSFVVYDHEEHFTGLILVINTSAISQKVDVNNFIIINVTLAVFNFSLREKILGIILLFKGQELPNSSYDILYSDFYLTENYTSITSEIIVRGNKAGIYSLELSTIFLYLIFPNESALASPQKTNFEIVTMEFVELWETSRGCSLALSLTIFLLTNVFLNFIIIKKYFLQKKKREEFFV